MPLPPGMPAGKTIRAALPLFMALLLAATAPAAMAAALKGGSPGGGQGCRAIFWQFSTDSGNPNHDYTQIGELQQDWQSVAWVEWQDRQCTVVYQNRQRQTFTLLMPGDRLRRMGHQCASDGVAKVVVSDCASKKPLYNVIISDADPQRQWFRGSPTERDGQAVIFCNCRGKRIFPATFPIVLKKPGYLPGRVNITFSGRTVDRYSFCLRRAGATPPAPAGDPRVLGLATTDWPNADQDFARVDRNLRFQVGLGKAQWGYGFAAVHLSGVKEVTISAKIPAKLENKDPNSFAGFVLDYETSSGRNKRVYMGTGMMNDNRRAHYRLEGQGAVGSIQYVSLPRSLAYRLALAKWAPPDWNGKVWFSVGIQNTGPGTGIDAAITSLK